MQYIYIIIYAKRVYPIPYTYISLELVPSDRPREGTKVVFHAELSLLRVLIDKLQWGNQIVVFAQQWSLFGGSLLGKFDCIKLIVYYNHV